jgi:hypothetical protein
MIMAHLLHGFLSSIDKRMPYMIANLVRKDILFPLPPVTLNKLELTWQPA